MPHHNAISRAGKFIAGPGLMSSPPHRILFDRPARHLRRARAARRGNRWLADYMADEVLTRLDELGRPVRHALVLGAEPVLLAGLKARGIDLKVIEASSRRAGMFDAIHAEEDNHGQIGGVFDLVVSAGGLDTVDDLPGALILARRALAPGGALLVTMFGAPSLTTLGAIILGVDAELGKATPHIHPQIDVRTAGDLLVRAGFIRAGADVDRLMLRYASIGGLVDDLRGAAATNLLAGRGAISRRWWQKVGERFAAQAQQGKTSEQITLLTLTGYAPETHPGSR